MAKWAEIFKVSTSGYYEWLQTKQEYEAREEAYKATIQEAADEGKRTYGADRIFGSAERLKIEL